MPKTEPKNTPAANELKSNGNGPLYVRCDLNAEQKRLLAEWTEQQEDMDLIKWVNTVVTLGHTVSIRSNQVGYQCSLTGTSEQNGHHNKTLISRASTPIRALYSVWYKDEIVLKGKWEVADRLAELDF